MKIDYVEIKTKLADMEVVNCGFCYSLYKNNKEFRERIAERKKQLDEHDKLFPELNIDYSHLCTNISSNSKSEKTQEELQKERMDKYWQHKVLESKRYAEEHKL